MSSTDEKKVLTREKRLGTLSHYNGTLGSISDIARDKEIRQRIRTLTQSTYDEILYAVSVLSRIEETAIIIHGAVGCAASGLYYNRLTPIHWYSTNLDERDTILGGEDKLRKTIRRACDETNAKVLFIVGTPVVAINNDDINSVILELEDETGVKLIPVYTDGFKTKAPVGGYDIVLHSLLRCIVERETPLKEEKEDFINVITLSENVESIASVVKILHELQIPCHLLPQYADIETMKQAGKARAAITLNPDEGSYFAEELEERFGVKYIRTEMPIGPKGTGDFIRKIAKELGISEKARQYIEERENRAEELICKKPLAGKKVFLDINMAAAVHFTDFINCLGGTVSGISVPYVDLYNRKYLAGLDSVEKKVPFMTASGQIYEKANILAKNPADYYVALEGNAAFSARYNCIPISLKHTAFLGYDGIEQFLRLLKRAADGKKLPYAETAGGDYYKPAWLKKNGNWYVKQEVG